MADRDNKGGKKTGLLIHFEKASKPLFCPIDQLNYRMVRAELGTVIPEEMIGKNLTLIPVKGDWFGEYNTLAIRVLVTDDKPCPGVGREAFGESVVGVKVLEVAKPKANAAGLTISGLSDELTSANDPQVVGAIRKKYLSGTEGDDSQVVNDICDARLAQLEVGQ